MLIFRKPTHYQDMIKIYENLSNLQMHSRKPGNRASNWFPQPCITAVTCMSLSLAAGLEQRSQLTASTSTALCCLSCSPEKRGNRKGEMQVNWRLASVNFHCQPCHRSFLAFLPSFRYRFDTLGGLEEKKKLILAHFECSL